MNSRQVILYCLIYFSLKQQLLFSTVYLSYERKDRCVGKFYLHDLNRNNGNIETHKTQLIKLVATRFMYALVKTL